MTNYDKELDEILSLIKLRKIRRRGYENSNIYKIDHTTVNEAKQAIVEAVEGIYGDSDGLREFASTGSNQVATLSELLEKFASIESPFDLFEPHLWYGKLGDEGWICSIRSSHMTLWEGSGATPLEAAQACYKKAMS